MRRYGLRCALILGVLLGCAGCNTAPVLNFDNEPIAYSNISFTRSDVKQAIISACKQRGWVPQVAADDHVVATIVVRGQYRATVDISYTDNSFSIHHKDSQNLKYDGDDIHKSYNRWVALLRNSIQRELGVRAQMF